MDVRWNGVRRRLLAALSVAAFAVAGASPAGALSLDEQQNFSLRMHAYSQLTLSMGTASADVTSPEKFTGQMMSKPDLPQSGLEAKFTVPAAGLARRAQRTARALWGFYDGLYDYGPGSTRRRWRTSSSTAARKRRVPDPATREQALAGNGLARNVRDIYAHRYRVNEAYVNISRKAALRAHRPPGDLLGRGRHDRTARP